MKRTAWVLVTLLALLAMGAFFAHNRYRMECFAGGCYVLDRWTGQVDWRTGD